VNYSRSKDEAEATAEEVRARGVGALAVQADVSRDADCRGLMESAVRELGRLDVLVQSAGTTSIIPHEKLDDVGDDDWDRILGVNLKGPFQCSRAARSALEASGGEIVNVSSVAGIAGTGSSIPYCASKAALNMLTITLARALAPRIRVNAVAPGFITGRWWSESVPPELYEAIKQGAASRSPLQAVCEPEDVSDAILSILTGSDLVTGQILVPPAICGSAGEPEARQHHSFARLWLAARACRRLPWWLSSTGLGAVRVRQKSSSRSSSSGSSLTALSLQGALQ
jgi:3-oxoacyl-[acyl-carrier protein] reductase